MVKRCRSCYVVILALTLSVASFFSWDRERNELALKQEYVTPKSDQISPRKLVCNKKVVRYIPSDLEISWFRDISRLASDDHNWLAGCGKLRNNERDVDKAISATQQHAEGNLDSSAARAHLSRHELRDTCTGEISYVYIEPLISFLRHPNALCREADILDKSYLVVPKYEEIFDTQPPNTWLFDAGASTYDTGAGGASQSWFVDTYRARGIEFDRIIGWEAAVTDPKIQWEAVPADIKRKTSWYNVAATSVPGDADNPLTFIKSLTKEEDYVVFKLDIDAPEVEIELVKQMMSDPELLSLVDEFYFEHHVSGSPMQWNGWGNLSNNAKAGSLGTLEDSYKIFGFLREQGVRAHSWV